MNRYPLSSLLALTFATIGAIRAQISTTPLPASSTGDYPISVVLAPTALRTDAIVSMWQTSRQTPVNVTNPFAPVVNVPASTTQDQYCRATYTRAFGGRLLTAHRFGGIRMWDASLPFINGPLPVLTTVGTTYSHEGLETLTDPSSGTTYLYYSEQHTSGTGQGGLRLYQVNASTLTPLGTVLTTGAAGNGLEVGAKGYYCWQWGDRNNNNLDGILRTYDTTNKLAPVELPRVAVPYTVSFADKYLEKNSREIALVGTLGNDGLRTFDITNPAAPTLALSISLTSPFALHIRGATFYPGSDVGIMWGYVQFGSAVIDFMWFFSCPTAATFAPIGSPFILQNFFIADAKFSATNLFVVGRNRTSLQSQLKIW